MIKPGCMDRICVDTKPSSPSSPLHPFVSFPFPFFAAPLRESLFIVFVVHSVLNACSTGILGCPVAPGHRLRYTSTFLKESRPLGSPSPPKMRYSSTLIAALAVPLLASARPIRRAASAADALVFRESSRSLQHARSDLRVHRVRKCPGTARD